MGLAMAKFPNEEKKTWQKMTGDDGSHKGGVENENDEETFGVEPTKHPYKVTDWCKSLLMSLEGILAFCCSLLPLKKKILIHQRG